MNKIRILLIGLGPNADRLYLPAIKEISRKYPVELTGVVDVIGNENDVIERLTKNVFHRTNVLFLKPEKSLNLSKDNTRQLNKFMSELEINAVIISTEPTAHKRYALWALSHDLPILMDKPITTRKSSSHSLAQANGIYADYLELLKAYETSKSPLFSISVQRRHHPGFKIVFDKIEEIRAKFGIPITTQQSLHADGQWRLPQEIIDQSYHPYNVYGKVSHSGYHFIDLISSLIKLSYENMPNDKLIDQFGVISSFVRPQGLLKQQNQSDYAAIFGKQYGSKSKLTDAQLSEYFSSYGEVDATSIIKLYKERNVVNNITLNLVHNSFSRRSWLEPGIDLYKGNGRVKHEYHNITQGPFQTIQVHSYQKNDTHDKNSKDDFALGGNNHFDIHIFRNKKITGDKQPLEIIRMQDIAFKEGFDSSLNIHDQIKHRSVVEFITNILHGTNNSTSDLKDHALSALLMSLVYRSGIKNKEVIKDISANLLKRN